MSGSGMVKQNRPDAMVEAGYLYFTYCGGMGAGTCLVPLGITGIALPYKVPKAITRHKRIIFENREFYGVRLYTNAGSNGLCPNSIGTEVPFYAALSADGLLTGEKVMAQGVQLSGPVPYEIEFKEHKIPQPIDPNYENVIYLQLFWGDTELINELGEVSDNSHTPTPQSFRIVKHDYEINL